MGNRVNVVINMASQGIKVNIKNMHVREYKVYTYGLVD